MSDTLFYRLNLCFLYFFLCICCLQAPICSCLTLLKKIISLQRLLFLLILWASQASVLVENWSIGTSQLFTDLGSTEGASISSHRPLISSRINCLTYLCLAVLWGKRCPHNATALWRISGLAVMVVGGTLYKVLVKSMCQARLEPEPMFGCSLWPSEINKIGDLSFSNALVHPMCR